MFLLTKNTKNILYNNNFFFVLCIISSFFIFHFLRDILTSTSIFNIYLTLSYIFFLVYIILNYSISYKDLDEDLKYFIIFISVSSATITFFHKPAVTFTDNDTTFNLILLLNYSIRYLCLVSIVGIFVSPAFSIISIGGYFLNYSTSQILLEGITKTKTDWLPVLEVSIYFISSIIILSFLKKQKYFTNVKNLFKKIESKDFLFAGLAVHFSNYFFSSIKKVALGENLLSWILENQTQNLIASRIYLNLRDFYFLDTLSFSSIYDLYSENYILLNATVVITQFLCLLCFFSRKLSLSLLIIYDFFHLMVYIVADIIFYKWILFNIAFFLLLKKISLPHKNKKIFFTLLILIAPHFFFVVKLGWFDLDYGHKVDVFAVTKEEKILVPNNYFLGSSFFFKAKIPKIYNDNVEVGGLFSKTFTKKSERYKLCKDIGYKKNDNYEETRKKFINTIRKIHNYHLKYPNINYNLYPHHIYSLKRDKKFENLDKKKIRYYLFTYEAVCDLSLKKNKITYNILKQETIKVDLN